MPKSFEDAPERKKSGLELMLESPDYPVAKQRIHERHVNSLIENARKAGSVEEAMRFAPGTSIRLMDMVLDAEKRRKAEDVAKAAREKWTPVLERIRNAADEAEARQALGELEKAVGEGGLMEVLDEMSDIRKERGEEEPE